MEVGEGGDIELGYKLERKESHDIDTIDKIILLNFRESYANGGRAFDRSTPLHWTRQRTRSGNSSSSCPSRVIPISTVKARDESRTYENPGQEGQITLQDTYHSKNTRCN